MSDRVIRIRETYHGGKYVSELTIKGLMDEASSPWMVRGELEQLQARVTYLEGIIERLLEATMMKDSKILKITGNEHLNPDNG